MTTLWEQARQTGLLPRAAGAAGGGAAHRPVYPAAGRETAALNDPELRLDLGGVAKGDAADRVAALLYALGGWTASS